MNIAHKLADVISGPRTPRCESVAIGPECFAAVEPDGTVHIAWKGEWYTRTPMSMRVRLHNWLVSR